MGAGRTDVALEALKAFLSLRRGNKKLDKSAGACASS